LARRFLNPKLTIVASFEIWVHVCPIPKQLGAWGLPFFGFRGLLTGILLFFSADKAMLFDALSGKGFGIHWRKSQKTME